MEEKIIIFLIGLLAGAVISTGAFFVYTTTANKCDNSTKQTMQVPSGNPPQMPSGDNNSNNNNQPPQQNNDNSKQ